LNNKLKIHYQIGDVTQRKSEPTDATMHIGGKINAKPTLPTTPLSK
jgi:hypothetical protein